MDLLVVRIAFILLLSVVCFSFRPFGLSRTVSAIVGATIAVLILLFELRIRAMSLKRLVGAVIGSILGIFGAFLFSLVLRNSLQPGRVQSLLELLVLLFMSYVGLVVGASKGELLNLDVLGNLFNPEHTHGRREGKILDTSSIIDGRIADMAETGFLEGPLLVPEFVLRELQMVADSQDGSKRQRGRRGLDILQRIQGNGRLDVQIVQTDYPHIRESTRS